VVVIDGLFLWQPAARLYGFWHQSKALRWLPIGPQISIVTLVRSYRVSEILAAHMTHQDHPCPIVFKSMISIKPLDLEVHVPQADSPRPTIATFSQTVGDTIRYDAIRWKSLTLVPAVVFWRRLPADGGGVFYPRHISSSRAHSNNIPTAIPIFSRSNVLMVPLPVSRDVDIHQKSKMAVAKMKRTYFTAVWLMKDNF